MVDYTPSPLNEKYFASQISIDGVGVEGQRKLFNSTVVLLGLSTVGTFVMRGLLAAGVGKIHIIDNSVVKEKDIGAYPIFNVNDIGKLKCIVLKEKGTAGWSSNRIQLHSIKLTKQNANIVLPKNFDFTVSTGNDPQEIKTLYDLSDERGFYIAGGTAAGWTCSFGIYTADKDNLYREKMYQFLGGTNSIKQEACMSGAALTAGGMITSITLAVLLGNKPSQSARFEMSMKDFTTVPLYANVNPFADILYKEPV